MLTLIVGVTLLLLGLLLPMPHPLNILFIILGVLLLVWAAVSYTRFRGAADQRGRWRW